MALEDITGLDSGKATSDRLFLLSEIILMCGFMYVGASTIYKVVIDFVRLTDQNASEKIIVSLATGLTLKLP